MLRGLYIPLPEPTRRALVDLADREWRRPHDQAALMLTDALRKRGALLPEEVVSAQPDAAADNNEPVASPAR